MPSVNCSPFGPKPQFELSTGLPAVGYKLFFYVAGSVATKQDTYTNSTGSVANTNPVVLNANGQPSTELWFASGLAYKAVLAPSTDTDPPTSPVWTIDNLRGINDTTSTADQWIASGLTPTFISATQFTVAGDQTSTFSVGRRIKATVTAGTVYGTVTVSAFAAVTTVTVSLDSGALDSGLSSVSVAFLTPDNSSVPGVRLSGGAYTFQFGATMGGSVAQSGVLTPAQITSNQNDYAPTGLATASVLRLSTDANRNVTGLTGGTAGRLIRIVNSGTQVLTLVNNSGLSTAANRFSFQNTASIVLNAGDVLDLQYDSTSAVWRSVDKFKAPTVTVLSSGSGTYTTPTGARALRVRLVGGGGGGAAANTNSGTTGGSTTFGGLTGGGGGGGGTSGLGAGGGAGGTASGGDLNIVGGRGGAGNPGSGASQDCGGQGGASPFGGNGGAGASGQAGQAAATNSGGGGGGSGQTGSVSGGGGGSGGYVEQWIAVPAATYAYAVGTAGGGGAAGGLAGGSGGSGVIIVEEIY